MRKEVWLAGARQSIPPKAYALLLTLLQHGQRVVGKHELAKALWPGVAVSDSVLARTVMLARRAIGDSAARQTLIRTLHGIGYRFVGEVAEVDPPAPAPAGGAVPPPGPWRIGILPCTNATGEAQLDWACHGLMALVGHALARDPRWEVVPVHAMRQSVAALPAGTGAQAAAHHAMAQWQLLQAAHASLRRRETGLWLDYRLYHADGSSSTASVRGSDAAQLGERFAQALQAGQPGGHATPVRFESADPFVNEAFARALALYDDAHFAAAAPLFAAACDLARDSALLRHWRLRCQAALRPADA